MFDLENAISKWKQNLRKNTEYEDGDIEELESHLRDRVDSLEDQGHYSENAFRITLEELGELEDLTYEFKKSKESLSKSTNLNIYAQLLYLIPSFFSSGVRNIVKRKGISFLNVFGLSVGIAAAILIAQFVLFEYSYDSFHKNKDRVYRVTLTSYQNGAFAWESATSYPAIAPEVFRTFPEIESAVRLYPGRGVFSFSDENGSTISFREEHGFYADSGFFDVFSLDLISGSIKSALHAPYNIIISESMAKKYFNDSEPIGETLTLDNVTEFAVSGVFEDYPENSHLEIDYLLSFSTLEILRGDAVNTSWGWYSFYTYLLLKDGVSPTHVSSKFPELLASNKSDYYQESGNREELSLQPLTDIYLFSQLNEEAGVSGNGYVLKYLVIIGIIILLIAWINYVNLTTAKSIDRAKEVGIRKTSGATRPQLIFQFLGESLLMNFLACIIAILLAYLFFPFLSQYSAKLHSFYLLSNSLFWILLGLGVVTGTLFSGLYPAFILSSFLPSSILKGSLKHSSKGINLRRGLVTFQFAISLILIVITITIFKQVEYMRNQEMGINIEQKLVVRGPVQNEQDNSFPIRFEQLKSDLKSVSGVYGVSNSSYVPGQEIRWTTRMSRDDIQSAIENTVYMSAIDYNFVPEYDLSLLAGRNFSEAFPTDTQAILINREAMNLFGFSSPDDAIQQSLSEYTIVGVFDNYYQSGLNHPFIPMVLQLQTNESRFITLRVENTSVQQTLSSIEQTYYNIFEESPFEFFFLDSYFDRLYQSDQQFGSVFSVFSLLAIFISCLGLFGLASLIISHRKKEIGIRKVLGANIFHTSTILLNEFWKLLIIAAFISFPIAYIIAGSWLKSFPNRIDVSYSIFFFAFLAILLFTIASISYHLILSIRIKPVESLKSE